METAPSLPLAGGKTDAFGLHRLRNKKVWIPLLVAFVAGMLVHSTIYLNGLVTPDGVWRGEHSYAGPWEVSLGRWGLYLVDVLHAGINSGTLIAALTVLYMALAGVLIVSLFQVKSMAKSILIPTVLTCSPMVAMFIAYPYCGDAYALSILLAVLAVYIVYVFSGAIQRTIASALCVAFLISLYQSSLGVMLAVAAGYIIMRLLRSPGEIRAIGRDMLHLLISVIIGVALYYALMQLALLAWGTSMAEYKGAGGVNIASALQNIPNGIKDAYMHFRVFFLEEWIVRNAYNTPVVYCVLAGFALVSLLMRFATAGQKRPYMPILCLALIVIFPVCCNVINLIVPDTEVYLLMSGGMAVTAPLLIAITDIDSGENMKKTAAWIQKALRAGGAVVAAALLWVFILSCQTDASVMLASKNQTVALINRIWQQVEANENYVPGDTPLLIAGHPQEGNYPNPSHLLYKANPYATWGAVWKGYDGNIHTWEQVFRQQLGVTYEGCTVEEYATISTGEAFDLMPLYPQEGSIQMIGDVLVIKISDTSDWTS